jgi:hypothetical protein
VSSPVVPHLRRLLVPQSPSAFWDAQAAADERISELASLRVRVEELTVALASTVAELDSERARADRCAAVVGEVSS